MIELRNLLAANQRVLLVGPPGCGKTARVQDVADKSGRRLIVMRASLSERVDFGGALVPDMSAGITRALPLELLADLQSTTVPTLLFLDDLGQAPIDVQAALMRLFDTGALSPHVIIWGATNRPGDVSGVTRLCEPLRSRFHLAYAIPTPGKDGEEATGGVLLGTWTDELDNWCNWAIDAGAPAEVIAWHRSTSGRDLYKWSPHADPAMRMPDYRSWDTVIQLWNNGLRDLNTISAAIGKPAAAEFRSFAQLAAELPTPDEVWRNPNKAPVPKSPQALYLIASMLANAATAKHAVPLIQYLTRLPRVYGALLGRDAMRRLGAALSGTREWNEWFLKNQELFATTN